MTKQVEDIPSIPHRNKWSENLPISQLSNPSISPLTTFAPALANFGSYLYMTFKASGSDDYHIYQCTYDGTNWAGNTQVVASPYGPLTSTSPALAVFNNTLYMAYKAYNNDGIWLSWLTQPTTSSNTWQGDQNINSMPGGITVETQHAPSLAVYPYNGSPALWMAYQYSSDFYVAVYQNSSWVFQSKISDMSGDISPESNYGPAIAAYKGYLYLIFKARHSNDLMWALYDGSTWIGNEDIETKHGVEKKPKSNYAPAIAVFDDKLYMIYKGENSNELYEAFLDNQVWEKNDKIEDKSNINPESNTSPGVGVFTKGLKSTLIAGYKGANDTAIWVSYYS